MRIERQHFVSQGFLRGFSAPDEKTDKFIWMYRKIPGTRPKRVSVKSVAWQSFYYEQETADGARDTDTVEARFANTIDRIVPAAIRSLDAIPGSVVSLTEENRGALAFFLGVSLTRVPSFREPIRELHTRVAQRAPNSVTKRDPRLAKFVEKYGVTAEAKAWVSLQPMVQMAEMVARSVLAKYWQFFVPPAGALLVTSDNPVIFAVADSYGLQSAGPAHPAAELVVNLRKDLALVCTPRHGDAQGAVFQMTQEEARKFNRGIVKAARQSVFAPTRSEEVEQLVRDHIGQEQTITLA
jgi:Protein of unknown function (DUF4238)